MFCTNCGKQNPEESKFCSSCGASTEALPPQNKAAYINKKEEMTFSKSISTCLSKYIDFGGRASRPEYWWFYLFTILLSWGAMLVDSSTYSDSTQIVSVLVNLALFLPSIAAGARRLHDTGRSGWWQLIAITIIGIIPLIIWLTSKGDEGNNKYGTPS